MDFYEASQLKSLLSKFARRFQKEKKIGFSLVFKASVTQPFYQLKSLKNVKKKIEPVNS